MNLFGMGSTELLVALVLALLVLGPQRLVRFARSAGKTVRRLRTMSSDLTKTITDAVPLDEDEAESEGPDADKKKVPRLKKITDEIKQALTLEDEKPAGGSANGEEAPKESPAEKGEEIGDSLRKIRQEIGEALSDKDAAGPEIPVDKDE
jgi:Tat protein translocase TatB subunit